MEYISVGVVCAIASALIEYLALSRGKSKEDKQKKKAAFIVVECKAENVKIAYIGGGSRAWAHNLMNDLAKDGEIGGTVRLYDIDHEGSMINERIGNALSAREDVQGKWTYKAYKTIGEALTGADFVVISILPATFDEMESDVHAPEQYGIYQSVGDTTGPGGVVRAMRTIPMFEEIAENIKKYLKKKHYVFQMQLNLL